MPAAASLSGGVLKVTFPGKIKGSRGRWQRMYTVTIPKRGRARVKSVPSALLRNTGCATVEPTNPNGSVIPPIRREDFATGTRTYRVVTLSTDADAEWYAIHGEQSNQIIAETLNAALKAAGSDKVVKVNVFEGPATGYDADALDILKAFAVNQGPDLYVAARTEIGTPTHDAVRLAEATLLAARQDVPRAILLATDGGPVCNESLDGQDCICTGGISSRRPCETRFCLDDTRTVATIAAARDRGIPTYVIGIDDPRDPVLRDTLDRMATAGGRRRAGPVSRSARPLDLFRPKPIFGTSVSSARAKRASTERAFDERGVQRWVARRSRS